MKREHLYVSQRNPWVWCSVLCVAASAAALSISRDSGGLWLSTVLSWVAAAVYALTVLVCGGDMLHRTAVPVWALGLCLALRSREGLAWACCLLLCAPYTFLISGRGKRVWLLPSLLAAMGGYVYVRSVSGVLMTGGLLLLLAALRVHADGKWYPTWGDRADGRWVRTAQVMEQITAYFMPNRTGANNLFAETVEITELERYIRQKRREGLSGYGINHAVLAAYVRTVAKYPVLNRFIAGQRIYSHGEDIAVCMTVKKELTASAPDSLVKVHLHPGDTAAQVYRKFADGVAEAKNEMQTTADGTVAAFMRVPRLLLKFTVWLLKTLDYFGLVPGFLLEISPFHGSVYFTNMGSLGIRPVYHHLYDFGTVPVFCAFGRKRRVEELQDGEIVRRKYLDLKFNLDERICDGYSYASVIRYFLRLLSRPDLLDEAPEEIVQDIP